MADVSVWEHALASDAALPLDMALADAAAELTALLSCADPYIRHDVAYTLLATWVERGRFDDLLPGLGDGICAGLRVGLGQEDTDTVFRRSYSALLLASVVARDNTARVVHPGVVLRWADHALHWFLTERDLRGHTTTSGWAHAVAHGADLLDALARSRHLHAAELGVVLEAVAQRLARTPPYHLHHTEEDRLASATMAIVRRDALTADALAAWVARLVEPLGHDLAGPYAAAHVNTLHYLRALHLELRFGAGERSDGRVRLLGSVRSALRGYHHDHHAAPTEGSAP